MAEDFETRLTLLERTAMSREAVIEREEKLLDRIDALMARHQAQSEKTLEHTLKMFGHDIADQLNTMRNRINKERDEKLDAAIDKALQAAPSPVPDPKAAQSNSPVRAFMAQNWIWITAFIITVALLRPDLAGSVLRLL
jgi:DNA replication protein DnaD